jgi:hypothetical protein
MLRPSDFESEQLSLRFDGELVAMLDGKDVIRTALFISSLDSFPLRPLGSL